MCLIDPPWDHLWRARGPWNQTIQTLLLLPVYPTHNPPFLMNSILGKLFNRHHQCHLFMSSYWQLAWWWVLFRVGRKMKTAKIGPTLKQQLLPTTDLNLDLFTIYYTSKHLILSYYSLFVVIYPEFYFIENYFFQFGKNDF